MTTEDATKDPRRPTFYLIGAAKSGTTTLAQHLRFHPNVFLTNPKEPNFFADDEQYSSGTLSYLNRYYAKAEGSSARGEATPGYFHQGSKVAPRIAELHPDGAPRLILLLRHPISRMWSHYRHRRRTEEESSSFIKAVQSADNPYFRDSCFAQQLVPWLETFGREALLILKLEDLSNDPTTSLALVWDHIGVNTPSGPVNAVHANVAAEAKSRLLMQFINSRGLHKKILRQLVPSHARRRLITRLRNANLRRTVPDESLQDADIEYLLSSFEPELVRLEALTGLAFPEWRHAPPQSLPMAGQQSLGVH